MADAGSKVFNWFVGLYFGVCTSIWIFYFAMLTKGEDGQKLILEYVKNSLWSPTSDPVFNFLWDTIIVVMCLFLIPGWLIVALVIIGIALAVLIPILPFVFLGNVSTTGAVIGILFALAGYGGLIWLLIHEISGARGVRGRSPDHVGKRSGTSSGYVVTGEGRSSSDGGGDSYARPAPLVSERRDQRPRKKSARERSSWPQPSREFRRGYRAGVENREHPSDVISLAFADREYLAGLEQGKKERVNNQVREEWLEDDE